MYTCINSSMRPYSTCILCVHVSQDNGLDMELMNLALMSTREDKVDVAKYVSYCTCMS